MEDCCISVCLYEGGAAAQLIWGSLLAVTCCYPGILASVADQCPLSAEANKELLCVTCTVKLSHQSKPPLCLYLPVLSRENDEPTRHSPTLQIDIIPPSYCGCYCVSLQSLITANQYECLWMHCHFMRTHGHHGAIKQLWCNVNFTPPRQPPVCRRESCGSDCYEH